MAAGEDWLQTSIVLNATRTNNDSKIGRAVMKSFKSLCEQFGEKTAKDIRARKYEQERHRNPQVEPEPFWLEHPDCPGNKDPETL